MKVLFVHDHEFKTDGELFFSNGCFPSEVWNRYTSVFDSLSVVGRDGGELNGAEEKKFTLSSANHVSFHLLHDMSNMRSLILGNKEAEDRVAELVAEHAGVIVRLPSRLGVLFLKEAKRQKKPYAVEVVGCPWDAYWNYGTFKAKLFAPYATWEMKREVRKANYALYVTRSFLQSRYPAHKDAITTSCSNVELPTVKKDVLQKRLSLIEKKLNNEKIAFGLIANYSSKYKGIDIAIKALSESSLQNWELQVLGNGDPALYKKLALELGVEKSVSFVGSLPSGEPVFNWLDSIDIYLHPSFQEGLPRALVEAMSRGCPALASNIAGIPELLEDDQMINAGDVKSLTKKIDLLAKDKSEQKRLAKSNFKKAMNYYKDTLDDKRSKFWASFKSNS